MEKFITALRKGMMFTAGILSTLATFYADISEKDIKNFIIMLCFSVSCFTAYEMIGKEED